MIAEGLPANIGQGGSKRKLQRHQLPTFWKSFTVVKSFIVFATGKVILNKEK